jgi:hypothetical protein
MGIDEVGILRDHHSLLPIGQDLIAAALFIGYREGPISPQSPTS